MGRVGQGISWRIWLTFAVLLGTLIFVRTVIDVVEGSQHLSGDQWVGLLVLPRSRAIRNRIAQGWPFAREKARTVHFGTHRKDGCCADRGTRDSIACMGNW